MPVHKKTKGTVVNDLLCTKESYITKHSIIPHLQEILFYNLEIVKDLLFHCREHSRETQQGDTAMTEILRILNGLL